jgi:hypothetical protein
MKKIIMIISLVLTMVSCTTEEPLCNVTKYTIVKLYMILNLGLMEILHTKRNLLMYLVV